RKEEREEGKEKGKGGKRREREGKGERRKKKKREGERGKEEEKRGEEKKEAERKQRKARGRKCAREVSARLLFSDEGWGD
ncbi:hypothetical protein ACC755_38025, partial [Rhizobium ruizarguesonis]